MQRKAKVKDTFNNFHLKLDKTSFPPANDNFALAAKGLAVEEIEATYEAFKTYLDRIGGPWYWNKRPKYTSDTATLKERLSDARSHLLVLKKGQEEIGYSLTVPRDDLSSEFGTASVGEIENFGIDVRYNNRGYGGPFFREVAQRLFNDGYGVIYLSTRDSNHPGVIPFYQKMGMSVVRREELPNDLIL